MAKQKTNEQMLRALLSDITPIEAALIRERLSHIMSVTGELAHTNPEKFTFVDASVWIALNDKVQTHIGFGGL